MKKVLNYSFGIMGIIGWTTTVLIMLTAKTNSQLEQGMMFGVTMSSIATILFLYTDKLIYEKRK